MSITDKDKRTQKTMTIIGICLCVILIPILLINMTLIIKGAANPDEVPKFFGMAPLIVLSGSMEGEEDIRAGDLIFIKNVDVDEIVVGDIIAYKNGTDVITHRIVNIEEGADGRTFTLRGDANNTDDKPVAESQIVGIYTSKVHGVGNLAMFLQKPIGMLCFVGIPLCFFILYDVFRRVKYAKKEESKTSELQAEVERLRALTESKADTASNAEANTEKPSATDGTEEAKM